MTLQDRKKPSDKAPDWVDQSFSRRLALCVMQLHLFGFIPVDAASDLFEAVGVWANIKDDTE